MALSPCSCRLGQVYSQEGSGCWNASRSSLDRTASSRWPLASQSCTPCWEGIFPVKMDIRAGEQTGEAQNALSNRVPLAASSSRLGVRISLFPGAAHPPMAVVVGEDEQDVGTFGHRQGSFLSSKNQRISKRAKATQLVAAARRARRPARLAAPPDRNRRKSRAAPSGHTVPCRPGADRPASAGFRPAAPRPG